MDTLKASRHFTICHLSSVSSCYPHAIWLLLLNNVKPTTVWLLQNFTVWSLGISSSVCLDSLCGTQTQSMYFIHIFSEIFHHLTFVATQILDNVGKLSVIIDIRYIYKWYLHSVSVLIISQVTSDLSLSDMSNNVNESSKYKWTFHYSHH